MGHSNNDYKNKYKPQNYRKSIVFDTIFTQSQ